VDDTFVVWPHGQDSLHEFLQYLNQQHSSIKFTMEQEHSGKLPFLDVLITRNQDGTLHHTIYRKPTHTNPLPTSAVFPSSSYQVISQPCAGSKSLYHL
jgi:hypothetical protein